MSKGPVQVVAAVIQKKDDPEQRILLVRRGPSQSGAGYWEFPGGKVEMTETSEAALIREIEEELGINIQVGESLGEEVFQYPTKEICLKVFFASVSNPQVQLREHDQMKWCLAEEINSDELSPADRPFVAKILNRSGK